MHLYIKLTTIILVFTEVIFFVLFFDKTIVVDIS